MFRFFLSPGAACGNVGASAPDGCHDAQLLGDFLDRDILRKPLESVDHGLLVRHGFDDTASEHHGQELESRIRRADRTAQTFVILAWCLARHLEKVCAILPPTNR